MFGNIYLNKTTIQCDHGQVIHLKQIHEERQCQGSESNVFYRSRSACDRFDTFGCLIVVRFVAVNNFGSVLFGERNISVNVYACECVRNSCDLNEVFFGIKH